MPDDGKREASPLFILGAPRSGTSWVYRMCCLHENAGWISNYGRRAPRFPSTAALNRLAARAPTWRVNRWFPDGEAYVYGSRRKILDRAFPSPVEGEPVFTHYGAVPLAGPSFAPHSLHRFVDRLLLASGATVFVSKRIAHNRRVPELRQAFPTARFLHVVRDGRDVARSLVRVDWWPAERLWWRDGGTVASAVTAGADADELAARHWLAELGAAEEGLGAVDPDQVLTTRYEDLVGSGLAGLEAVLRFAGLDVTPRWRRDAQLVLDRRRPAHAAEPGTAPEVVEAVQAPTLLRMGYSQ